MVETRFLTAGLKVTDEQKEMVRKWSGIRASDISMDRC